MAERETCLVISASTWFEVIGGAPTPEVANVEVRVRCRVVVEGSQVVLAVLHQLADASGRFERLAFGPELRSIPRFKILREEAWEPRIQHRARTIEPQSYQSDDNKWRPKAIIETEDGGAVRTDPVWAPSEVTFPTEAIANACAVEMGKRWIDERG
jgi:hypothetical protein